MLIPYFTVLTILSVYGLHRYDLIRTYFKHEKNATAGPPKRYAQLPAVTIQLPLYNERYVVERLIEVVKIENPKELLQIQVLTIPPTISARSPKFWWSVTTPWAIRSNTTTVRTATLQGARFRKA